MASPPPTGTATTATATTATTTTTSPPRRKRGDGPPNRLLKYTSYLYRNPSLTESEFHQHWRSVHARLPIAAMRKHGIVKYSQYHTTCSTRALAQGACEGRIQQGRHVTYAVGGYDAVIQIWVQGMEDLEGMGGEEVFVKEIFGDEAELFDKARGMVLVGWEEDILVDGVVVGIEGWDEERDGK